MRTLTIELRWPFPVRAIEGAAMSPAQVTDKCKRVYEIAEAQGARDAYMELMADPPPLFRAVCASKERAEAGRRGHVTRRARRQERLEVACRMARENALVETATDVAAAVAYEVDGGRGDI